MNPCQYTRRNLLPYIQNDLPRRQVRRISSHLQKCETCYTEYINQRDTTRQLENELATLGRPSQQDITHIWRAVQANMEAPQRAEKRLRPLPPLRRGLVGVMFAVLCVLPWMLSTGDFVASAAVPVVVLPPQESPEGTPESKTHTNRVSHIEVPTENAQPPTPTSTPAVAPVPDEMPELRIK